MDSILGHRDMLMDLIFCQSRCQTDAVVNYWMTSQLMSWLWI